MGGLYDLLETYRIQNDPRFAYEGLYQDPRRDDTTYYDGDLTTYPYGSTDADELQPLISSAFPQDYGVGSLFNPRVGRPEQSIYYNEPEPADPTSDFYQPLPGFINAPQNYYPAIRAMQPAPTSLGFDTSYGVANEEDEEQVESLVEEEPSGIQKLIKTAMRFAIPGLSFLENIAGRSQPYQQFSPGTTIRNGIVNVAGVNTPYSMFGGDFYNPNTGLNRFDRAAQRFTKTGSMADLFASSRTGKEFFEKRRQIQAQKQKKLEDAAKAKIKFKQDTGGGGGGFGGSRRGDADISDSQRGGFATDDTAGFF